MNRCDNVDERGATMALTGLVFVGFSTGVLLAGHAEEPSMALVLGIPASHGPANKTPALKPQAQRRD